MLKKPGSTTWVPSRLSTFMQYTTQFLLSAMAPAQFPAPTVPEIAFLGRSNVGKSSQRPLMQLADLPGYGYAKISKSISAEWPKFIEPYLAERPTLELCVCLVDSNVPPQPRDRQLIDWLRHVGRAFLVVATKTDRLSGNQRTRNLAALKNGLELDEILAISAKTGIGMKELWGRIDAVNKLAS